ncbi:MAG TPA: DUF2520 domain-containing protein [Myxococcales bacterium]|nr:DUF2520 domain-containing protein [Myxococcales bacterium]
MSLVIVGFGRLGGALALGLRARGWPLAVFPRSETSVRRAAELGFTLADHEDLARAAACVLAVPDRVVRERAEVLAPDLGKKTALVHCAGALTLEAFGPEKVVRSRPLGSFHPLVAVSSLDDSLAGHTVAVSASQQRLIPVLKQMARDLELHAIEVPERTRAAYHAGAVLVAGGSVALLSSAVEAFARARIPEAQATRALVALMRSALRGAEKRGLSAGLTGPVVRGDAEVVRSQLAALPRSISQLYRALSRFQLDLAHDRLTPHQRGELEDVLADRTGGE